MMTQAKLTVAAEWDPDACVWVASSDDVPGLITEAASIEELMHKLSVLVPELLNLNGHLLRADATTAPIELVAKVIVDQARA